MFDAVVEERTPCTQSPEPHPCRWSRPSPVRREQARSLHRWNAAPAVLHLVQGLVILALSFARDPMVSAPVVSSYLALDPATSTLVPPQRTLFELPIGPAVAAFFFLSAGAHAMLAFPGRSWHESRLARGQNPARWVEYALFAKSLLAWPVFAGTLRP